MRLNCDQSIVIRFNLNRGVLLLQLVIYIRFFLSMGLKLPLLCTPTFSRLSLPGVSPIVIDLQYSEQAINTGRYK